jgi:hypothetical protein
MKTKTANQADVLSETISILGYQTPQLTLPVFMATIIIAMTAFD